MNRRNWLKVIVSLVPACLVSKAVADTATIDDGKIGYIAVGIIDEHGRWLYPRAGDIRVISVDGKPWDNRSKLIQRANDREGWIEYMDIGPVDEKGCPLNRVYWPTIHKKCDVRLELVSQ